MCDLDRFEIHTNFTGFAAKVYAFDLDGLADPKNLGYLRLAFTDPMRLRPDQTQEAVTEEIAEVFKGLADGLRSRGEDPQQAAHFLMRLMFCMFAEDVELLPRGLFTETVASTKYNPEKLRPKLKSLFEAMSTGGTYGPADVPHFNGGLFDGGDVLDLTALEIKALHDAALKDWSDVEPSVFGTLFERMLNPEKRSQLGAHYTSRADIETLLKPVMEAPLRREWDAVRATADALWEKVKGKGAGRAKARKDHDKALEAFHDRLAHVTVLDPACGSGNFLYVALNMLLDLEKEVRLYGNAHDITLPQRVRPTQLSGIELNEYAQQLAQEVIWIGFLQWIEKNGDVYQAEPILDKLETIRRMDAILDLSDPTNPKEPEWPAAEFIVGNPPFLGGKLLRKNLGDDYVDAMFAVWGKQVRPEADLVVYWFEKARAKIEAGTAKRAGLIGTQGIRGGANRATLTRIKESGNIFFAVSDRDWVLDGANVHISMVGFDDGSDSAHILDDKPVETIHANLTASADVTLARKLPANAGIGFMGDTKGGPFDIDFATALRLLTTPNVNGRPSSDVITPWANGKDVTQRSRDLWIIDFGVGTEREAASGYDSVFEHLRGIAEEARSESRSSVKSWWLHERPRVDMRKALAPLDRYLVTPNVTKHRLFSWTSAPNLADHQLIAFASADDYTFGILHSAAHEIWARSQGSQLREVESGFRYTPTTCFETFPFPTPTPAQAEAVATAAKQLDALRSSWLNPPEWTKTEVLEFPGSVDGPWKRYVHNADGRGIGTVRYPRAVAKDAAAAKKLKDRTLTKLYNERPTWLADAHRRLDEAVFQAYGWASGISSAEILINLLSLALEQATS